MPDGDNGLVCAYALDGQGGGRALDWPEVEAWQANDGLQWVHLSRRAEGAQRWLEQKSGLDPVVQEALLAEETRPHCDLIGEGVLLILRGINTNPGADPTDMVSIRLWIEEHRVVSSRHRKVSAIRSLQDAIAAGRGPHSASDLVSDLARALLEHCRETPYGSGEACRVPYEYLAGKFLEYYWHQECKFRIKQDFKTKSTPKVVQAIRSTFTGYVPGGFGDVDGDRKDRARRDILNTVFGSAKAKTSLVVPKFQKVMEGSYAVERRVFYDYDDDEKVVTLRPAAFAFFKNNNGLLSRAVLAEWAKFLERINGSLPRLVAKIEQDEARREPLTRFRNAYMPHTDHCFYCCGMLERGDTHVDHFLPWSYIFEDEAWNLVLACSRCNLKKSDSLPQDEFRRELIRRNGSYRDRIGILDSSLRIIDTRLGWEREIQNHYETCQEYGFNVIRMP